MNQSLEKYLTTVDRHLKPLPVSERADIVKEIKSTMLEMESEQMSSKQILDRLGSPKDLAKAYLKDLLVKEKRCSVKRFLIRESKRSGKSLSERSAGKRKKMQCEKIFDLMGLLYSCRIFRYGCHPYFGSYCTCLPIMWNSRTCPERCKNV